jgi:DNA-binding LacI/PurR family transcriptional regulator
VEVDRAAIGRIAAEAILARLSGHQAPSRITDVGFAIVDRETT